VERTTRAPVGLLRHPALELALDLEHKEVLLLRDERDRLRAEVVEWRTLAFKDQARGIAEDRAACRERKVGAGGKRRRAAMTPWPNCGINSSA